MDLLAVVPGISNILFSVSTHLGYRLRGFSDRPGPGERLHQTNQVQRFEVLKRVSRGQLRETALQGLKARSFLFCDVCQQFFLILFQTANKKLPPPVVFLRDRRFSAPCLFWQCDGHGALMTYCPRKNGLQRSSGRRKIIVRHPFPNIFYALSKNRDFIYNIENILYLLRGDVTRTRGSANDNSCYFSATYRNNDANSLLDLRKESVRNAINQFIPSTNGERKGDRNEARIRGTLRVKHLTN